MIPPIEVCTTIALEPTEVFRVFTEEIDAWWLDGARFRPQSGRLGVLELEPWAGGRLLERYPPAEGLPEAPELVLARVRVFEPPRDASTAQLVLELLGHDFGPEEHTLVEVGFVACPGGTRVEVTHGGWDELPADHPALHGLEGVALASLYGLWWADLLGALQRRSVGNRGDLAGCAGDPEPRNTE